ncbi:MAG: hypothetical protein JXR94_12785 [Candidatus Hydrogenedentes bacterium]|nr:hypothetical protein [Candidatus Hydrogenedentota bacterium]
MGPDVRKPRHRHDVVVAVGLVALCAVSLILAQGIRRREESRRRLVEALHVSDTVDGLLGRLTEAAVLEEARGPSPLDVDGRSQLVIPVRGFPHAFLFLVFERHSGGIEAYALELGENRIGLGEDEVLCGHFARLAAPGWTIGLCVMAAAAFIVSKRTAGWRRFAAHSAGVAALLPVMCFVLSASLYCWLWWL